VFQIWNLQRVLMKKRDPVSHKQFMQKVRETAVLVVLMVSFKVCEVWEVRADDCGNASHVFGRSTKLLFNVF
jgi:hypothetical protein